MEVGIRQLRDQLRRWLNAVENGAEVIVTERGRPVAKLVPVSTPPGLDRLIADGIVTPADRPKRPSRVHTRVKSKGSVSELVPEQRR